MNLLGTVLYEDSMLPGVGGGYPLHDLVMRIVEDKINGETYRLRSLINANPRKGIDNVLNDLGRTSLIAGTGQLFALVDRDKVVRHLAKRGAIAPAAQVMDHEVIAAIQALSDAPTRLQVFLLRPNMEGLLRHVQGCDPTLLPAEMAAALRKKLNARDIVLNEVKRAARIALRECLRKEQPGLFALADAFGRTVAAAST